MNDFRKKSKKSLRQEKLTYIENAASLFIGRVCISVNSMPLCSHSGTNKNFPVRQHSNILISVPESLKLEQRASVDFMGAEMECKCHSESY